MVSPRLASNSLKVVIIRLAPGNPKVVSPRLASNSLKVVAIELALGSPKVTSPRLAPDIPNKGWEPFLQGYHLAA